MIKTGFMAERMIDTYVVFHLHFIGVTYPVFEFPAHKIGVKYPAQVLVRVDIFLEDRENSLIVLKTEIADHVL